VLTSGCGGKKTGAAMTNKPVQSQKIWIAGGLAFLAASAFYTLAVMPKAHTIPVE